MIAGEYAVMGPGGTCIAVATGRLVEVWCAPGGPAEVWVEAFGQRQRADAGSHGLGVFAAKAIQVAAARWGLQSDGQVLLQVQGTQGGQKVGLGTSAAVTVATLRALAHGAGFPLDAANLSDAARAVHQAVQGAGSGYDVTTISYGGCVRYDRDPDRATRLSWPAGLAVAALYTGEGAPTAPALARVTEMGPTLAGIDAATRALQGVWASGSADAVLAALATCERALEAAAERVSDLLTPAVRRTRDFCRDRALVARTSGAGGGDCVLACGSAEAVRAAALAWQGLGQTFVSILPDQLEAVDLASPRRARDGI